MKTDNLNAPGEFGHAKTRGHVGLRAGSGGITISDTAGNEVDGAIEERFAGASVSETTDADGNSIALVTITSTGEPDITNSDSITLNYGDVVVQQADGSVATTTTAQDTGRIGVVVVGGASGNPVTVIFQGRVEQINTTASVTEGNYAETSTVAGQATENATARAGSFGRYLSTGSNPPAVLFGQTYLSGGGGGGSGSTGWYNVRDYGAIGDGSTDDRAACQAAADAAAVTGGVLYFPAGSYKITTPGLDIDPDVAMLGDGRESTFLLAGTNSINIVTITGTATESTYEINHASTVNGLTFSGNSHTGCEGIAYIGVAYFDTRRCEFTNLAVGVEYYGSLQGRVDDCKFVTCTRGLKYSAQSIGYYGGTLPPARVEVNWSTFYYCATWAIDWSGGQQIFVNESEFGDNGTNGNASTGAITATMGGDSHGFGLVGRNLWMEANHGGAAIKLSGTVVGQHSLTDCWFAYNDATYSVQVDGSTAAQTLIVDRVYHDTVVSPATVSTFRSAGGTTYLDARRSNGSTSGTWTAVRQEPLLSEQLVSDLSGWLALRLPNVTTTQRDAISSPTAGMIVWNTSTTAVNQYTGSAWATVGFANPMTTRGDLIIEDSTPTPIRLAIGASGTVLSSDGTDPSWQPIPTPSASHAHVVGETHLSDGSTTTYTLDQQFEPGSVEAFNTTTLAYLVVTEAQPDQATVSAAGSSGDKITFSYAATVA